MHYSKKTFVEVEIKIHIFLISASGAEVAGKIYVKTALFLTINPPLPIE
jgi:hypothetical protein